MGVAGAGMKWSTNKNTTPTSASTTRLVTIPAPTACATAATRCAHGLVVTAGRITTGTIHSTIRCATVMPISHLPMSFTVAWRSSVVTSPTVSNATAPRK